MLIWDRFNYRCGDTINKFIKSLRNYRGRLPSNILKTIRGQALNGDLDGAKNGLEKALNKYNIN